MSGATINISNLNASLQVAHTNIGLATKNITDLNSSKLDALPSINFTTDIGSAARYFLRLFVGDLLLNGTSLFNYTAQATSNISSINSTVVSLSQTASNISEINSTLNAFKAAIDLNLTGLNATTVLQGNRIAGLSINLSNINLSIVALSQTAKNISELNRTKLQNSTDATFTRIISTTNISINANEKYCLNGTGYNCNIDASLYFNSSCTVVEGVTTRLVLC